MIERKFIKESIKRLKTRDHVKKQLEKAGIVDVDIQRTTLNTRIGIIAERPGLVIGRKGGSIKDLSEAIEKELGIENPQIEVADVTRPNLEPSVICRMIKRSVERGIKPKRVMKIALSKIMGSGAMGAEIVIDGAQSKGARSRKDRISAGYIKKAGDSVKNVKEARDQALLKQGVLGITVRIVPPEVVFPDKIIIKRKTGLEQISEETAPSAEEKKAADEAKSESTGIKEIADETKPTKAEKTTAKEAIKEIADKQEKIKKTDEFKCDECGRTFTTKRGLTAHSRIHK